MGVDERVKDARFTEEELSCDLLDRCAIGSSSDLLQETVLDW